MEKWHSQEIARRSCFASCLSSPPFRRSCFASCLSSPPLRRSCFASCLSSPPLRRSCFASCLSSPPLLWFICICCTASGAAVHVSYAGRILIRLTASVYNDTTMPHTFATIRLCDVCFLMMRFCSWKPLVCRFIVYGNILLGSLPTIFWVQKHTVDTPVSWAGRKEVVSICVVDSLFCLNLRQRTWGKRTAFPHLAEGENPHDIDRGI